MLLVTFALGCSSDPSSTGSSGGSAGVSHAGTSSGSGSVGGSFGSAGSSSGGASGSVGSTAGSGYTAGYAGSTGAGGSGTAGYTGTSGSSGAAGVAGAPTTCDNLFPEFSAALASARACNPAQSSQQCTGTVTDFCMCTYPVNAANTQAVNSFNALKQQIVASGCVFECTGPGCPGLGTAYCAVSSSSSSGGLCASQ